MSLDGEVSCQSFVLGTVGQKNCKRTILPSEIKTLCKRGLLSADSWKKISGKSTDNVVLKYPILFFILKQLSALIFFHFVLAFLLQHNINFKKSKLKQNVSVSITTKPVNQLEIP